MAKKLALTVGLVFLLDIFLLTLLGKNYTSLLLVDPYFYAHDLMLLFMVILSIPFYKPIFRIKGLELIFTIAIIYLIYSFFNFDFENSYYLLRQFVLFGYGIAIYIILNTVFKLKVFEEKFSTCLFWFALFSVIVQFIYISYLFVNTGESPFFQRNYFTPAIVIWMFILASYVLVNIKNNYLKHIIFTLIFIISFSTGHDSTYLSLLLIYFLYLFLILKKRKKLITLGVMIFIIILLPVLIPSFADVNSQWRIIFWKDSFLKISNNYFIFGDGFGIQFASDEAIIELNKLYPHASGNPKILESDKKLCTPHNSFISMALHIGIFSIIALFYPFKILITNSNILKDKEVLFLILSLFGTIVFSCFNVLLELPHASSLFWLIYLTLILKKRKKSDLFTNK